MLRTFLVSFLPHLIAPSKKELLIKLRPKCFDTNIIYLALTLLQLYVIYRTPHLLSMKTMQPNSSLALGKSYSKSHRKRICIRSKVKKSIIVSFVVSYSMMAKTESSLQHHSTHHNWNFHCPLLETVYK